MAGITKLLARLGYVKLDAYGLLRTPEDRILATRPTILDDGLGGRVVGWRDHDLAAAELAPYVTAAAKPKPKRIVAAPPIPAARVPAPAAPVIAPAPAPVAPAPRPLPGVAPYVPPVAAAPAPAPAPAPELTEDEWEWEIAVARARAAAEEVQLAARVIPIAQARKLPLPPERAPSPVVATRPAPVIPLKPTAPPAKPVAAKPAPKPAIVVEAVELDPSELGDVGEDTQVTLTAEMAKHAKVAPRAASPQTIIPVPKLPRAGGVRLDPVTAPSRAVARMAKGTRDVTEITRTDVLRVAPATTRLEPVRIAPAPVPATALPSIKRRATT